MAKRHAVIGVYSGLCLAALVAFYLTFGQQLQVWLGFMYLAVGSGMMALGTAGFISWDYKKSAAIFGGMALGPWIVLGIRLLL